jgi:tetratricopeptide (TPR) repeat protein
VKKVETGVLKGFSIGIKNPRVTRDKVAANGRIVDGQIVEVSLVDRPANPNCQLVLAKSASGEATLIQVEDLIEGNPLQFDDANLLKEAKAQYEIVTQDLTYTNQFRNYYNLALLELRIGDRKEAYEYLEKSIKEKEDYCQAHFKLGELYMEEYKFTQALSSFQESSKGTCVTEPAPHYQQALALINLNRFEEARIKLKMLMEKHGKTRFYSLSQIQLKKISDEIREQATLKTFQTETVKESQSVESPNF